MKDKQALEIITTTSPEASSSSPHTPPTPPNQMASLLRRPFDRISAMASSWSLRRNTIPRGRRMYSTTDAQDEELHATTTRCLSSYYSVFVVRLAIMVMLAILIGLLTILTWHFTRVYTTKSLDTLAYGLRYELLQRPMLRMWNILNSTAEITAAQVKLSEYVIRRYHKKTTQAEQIELYEMMKDVTWALFASRKALNAITINYRNGFVQAFHRDHRSNNTFYIYSDLSNYSISAGKTYATNLMPSRQGWNDQSIKGNVSAIWYREPLDPTTGEKVGKARPIPPDDLINIAGLSQVPDGVASWHVAVSKYTDSPLLSAALPVWDPSNASIVAVVGVTTALFSVGQLMKELVEVHSGHIYLTSQEGYLLATSTNAPLLTNSTGCPKLVMAVDSENHVIRMGAQWLKTVYGNNFPPGHVVHIENAKLGLQRYYIDSFFLNLKRLPIVGVIIIPRGYIMGKADERALKTLIILISASVCILIIGCLCILILTNGVSKEMKLRAELISHLDARRRAEASNNYKSQFLANMSHELRTPMAAVIGLLDLLITSERLNGEQFAAVSQIRKCSTALLRLLNNILDLSKVESGKLVLEDADFNLGQEIEGLIDMYSVQCADVETVLDLADDMPNYFRGDSARIVQIFSNLISNSIKFTTSGHVIIRGWCETWNSFKGTGKFLLEQKRPPRFVLKSKSKQQVNNVKKACKNENKMILWFEIDDTGIGIDPAKWETVFESFEQADPSTTRMHGGTGLGLCIVRTLVHKMGGEIKVVKKDTPGTLMRLYLLLNTPLEDREQPCPIDFSRPMVVLLALTGSVGRQIMSQWLRRNNVTTFEVSKWNELTQLLPGLCSRSSTSSSSNGAIEKQNSLSEELKSEMTRIRAMPDSAFIIVIDIGILDFTTTMWVDQLNYLDRFSVEAKFAWTLRHDTPNFIKVELRNRGYSVLVNKPLYKAKMIYILESLLTGRNVDEPAEEGSNENATEAAPSDSQEGSETVSTVSNSTSSASSDSDLSEKNAFGSVLSLTQGEKMARIANAPPSNQQIELTQKCTQGDLRPFSSNVQDSGDSASSGNGQASSFLEIKGESSKGKEVQQPGGGREGGDGTGAESSSSPKAKGKAAKKKLEGLQILLVEDTKILQKVAAKLLQVQGATVFVAGDGKQALRAVEKMIYEELGKGEPPRRADEEPAAYHHYDLVLMDCQMPVMDGYESTQKIRELEVGTPMHTPIIALTAHAMLSDEAKCLSVGMDAYLTKPINNERLLATILNFTKRSLGGLA